MNLNITKRLTQEAHASHEATFRALRYERQRKVARVFSRSVHGTWTKFEKELFSHIGKLAESRGETAPSLRSIVRQERNKILHQENIQALTLIANFLSPEEIAAMEALFQNAGLNMRGIFADHLRRTYQDGLDLAYDWMKDGHPSERANRLRRQDQERFEQIPEAFALADESPFFRSFYDDALETVTSKTSIYFKGEAFAAMVDGLTEGRTWREIATAIRKDVGTGALWHWRRLIRTEMAAAYDRSMVERYTDAGVQYVKRSLAQGACPICVGQKGVYKLGTQPRVPTDSHPNCRCTYIPYYVLPKGVEIRTGF